MKKIKRSTIQKQLFKKYLIGFIIFQIFFVVSTSTVEDFMSEILASAMFSADDVYKNIDTHGLNNNFLNRNLPKNSYIEILDLNYKVKFKNNSPHNLGFTYSNNTIKDICNQKQEHIDVFFLKNTQELLLVCEQPFGKITFFYISIILIFLFSMLALYVIFFKIMAKIISNTLDKPIKALTSGINAFKERNYSYRISFNSKNELDNLKDAFNDMAMTIENEMSLRKQAQDANKQMILDITHDLKTPLTNIQGYSELLKDKSNLDADLKDKYLDIIISNSTRTSKLITDLFDITKLDFNEENLNKEKSNLSELVRRLLVEYITIFEDNSKEYDFDIPDKAIWINLDKKMIERAICNILNNFINYSGDNTKVIVSLKEHNNEIELSISDNGKGISKEKTEEIFLPFVREDYSRNSSTGGTGLGLAITKKIVEKHDGKINLISDINKGCKFIIILPYDITL